VELPDGTFSGSCAFCDSPLVDDAITAEQRPDRVVPFVVPRARASRLLGQFLAGSWLAPEALRKAVRPDALEQVFVPFYVYDAKVRSRFSASIGLYWYRTETYTKVVNGKTTVRTRQVRETEWKPLQGTHARRWFDHLVSASTGLPEAEANALEPFDLGQTLPYAPALTAGVAAEIPTVGHDEALTVARSEFTELERRTIAQEHLPGDTHRNLQSTSEVEIDEISLVLLPVWTAVYPTAGVSVRLLVNGQTGEVVGAIPRSRWKIGCLVAAAVGLVLVVASATGLVAVVSSLLGALVGG
jgi:hypothetical protein